MGCGSVVGSPVDQQRMGFGGVRLLRESSSEWGSVGPLAERIWLRMGFGGVRLLRESSTKQLFPRQCFQQANTTNPRSLLDSHVSHVDHGVNHAQTFTRVALYTGDARGTGVTGGGGGAALTELHGACAGSCKALFDFFMDLVHSSLPLSLQITINNLSLSPSPLFYFFRTGPARPLLLWLSLQHLLPPRTF